MLKLSKLIHRSIVAGVVTASCTACASSPDFSRSLGVMPLQPPPPVWLGSVRSTTGTSIAGAAAITPSQTPGWAHVLLSLADTKAGGIYSWSLRSGSCGAQGGVIGPSDRYGEFLIHPDGTGAADALVPLALSAQQTYAVVAEPISSAGAPSACADLVRSAL